MGNAWRGRGCHARVCPLLLCCSPRAPPHARLSKWRSTPTPSSSLSTPGSLSPSPYDHSRAEPPWPAAMPHGLAWPSHHEAPRAKLSGLMDAGKSPGAPPPLPRRRRGHHWPESAKPTVWNLRNLRVPDAKPRLIWIVFVGCGVINRKYRVPGARSVFLFFCFCRFHGWTLEMHSNS